MMPSDPAGLLQRMPELQRIVSDDEKIRAALATGDPFKLYRALRWASWTGRLNTHKEVVQELLGNRRLFARALTGSPGLYTLNSFGVGFVGESERHPDGTYITGHFLVILFKLPLLPLGAYLVGAGDTDNTYRIFARVPLGGFSWAWSRAVALAAAVLIASGAWGAFQDSRFATVTVANGFRKALQVEVGGKTATIGPNSTAALTVPVGSQPARAVLEGNVVDEGPINVESGNDAFVWNVGGVSPIYKVDIEYYATEPAFPPPPRVDFYCAERLIVQRDVNFFFREPDKTTSMSKGVSVVRKVMMSANWGAEEIRSPCLTWLYLEGNSRRLETVITALKAAGELSTEDESLGILSTLMAGSDDGVWDRAKALKESRGNDLSTARTVMWAAEETGHLEELLADLRSRAEQKPDDADAAYLVLRASPEAAPLSEWESLLKKFPGHDATRRSVEFAALREGQWERSYSVWKLRLEDEPEAACGDADLATQASIGLHREAEVLQALEECGDPSEFDVALAATRLSIVAQKDAQPWVSRVQGEPLRQRLRLFAGLPVKDIDHTRLEPLARFLTALHKSDDAVFLELPNLPQHELQSIDPEVATIVWAEAVRRKNSPAAATLARRTRLTAVERKAVERYINGAQPELEPKRFSPLVRAIAYFTRSRVEGVAAPEKARLQKLVRQDGVLGGFVVSALDHWP